MAEAEEPAGAAGAAAAAEPLVEGTDQWVQCDRCRTWRIVPDQHWPSVEADPRDVRTPAVRLFSLAAISGILLLLLGQCLGPK